MDGVDDTRSLVDAAAGGDRLAVDRLIERHLPQLRAFVRLRAGALIRAQESSSDIVQSVCREVLQHVERFQHPSEAAFKQWLFRTALRKLSDRRDFYLAEKRDVLRARPIGGGEEDGPALAESQLVDVYRRFSSPSHRAEVRDEIAHIESAFDQLTEAEREIVTLAYVVGASRIEIAEILGKSPGAVRVALHRALAKLVDLVAADEDGDAGAIDSDDSV